MKKTCHLSEHNWPLLMLTFLLCIPVCNAQPASAPQESKTNSVQAAEKFKLLERWSPSHIVMLYKREEEASPSRLDSAVASVTQALEETFLAKGYRISQPSPDVYRLMDKGPGVIVNFAPDAGLSMVYSVFKSQQPDPGTDVGTFSIRIEARVFIGSTLLVSRRGKGHVRARLDAAMFQSANANGYESAARDAAEDLVQQVDTDIKQHKPEELRALALSDQVDSTTVVIVDPPSVPPPKALPPPEPMTKQPSLPPVAERTLPPVQSPPVERLPTVAPAKKWLVEIGVTDYSAVRSQQLDATDLPGMELNLRNISRALSNLGFGNSEKLELKGGDANSKAVLASIDLMKKYARPSDTVVMYIGGHGMAAQYGRENVTQPVFVDYVLSRPGPDFKEIVSRFSEINAANLVMLFDTCHSGAATGFLPTVVIGSEGVSVGKNRSAPDLRAILSGVREGANLAVLSASKVDEVSLYTDAAGEDGGGMFTSEISKTLRGPAGNGSILEIYSRTMWPVVARSTEGCKQLAQMGKPCPAPQQTPTLGYTSDGGNIRLAQR